MGNMIKNIQQSSVLSLAQQVQIAEGQVVSRTLAQNPAVSLTLFAFDTGEEISAHASNGDAMVTVLEGEGRITIDEEPHTVKEGESIVMPAGIPHAVHALTPFKMMLTVIF